MEREFTEQEMRHIETRWKSDVDLKLDRVDGRVRIIERLVWIATGGVAVLSAVSVLGLAILSGFAAKLDIVSNAQAITTAESNIRQENLQRQINELKERER